MSSSPSFQAMHILAEIQDGKAVDSNTVDWFGTHISKPGVEYEMVEYYFIAGSGSPLRKFAREFLLRSENPDFARIVPIVESLDVVKSPEQYSQQDILSALKVLFAESLPAEERKDYFDCISRSLKSGDTNLRHALKCFSGSPVLNEFFKRILEIEPEPNNFILECFAAAGVAAATDLVTNRIDSVLRNQLTSLRVMSDITAPLISAVAHCRDSHRISLLVRSIGALDLSCNLRAHAAATLRLVLIADPSLSSVALDKIPPGIFGSREDAMFELAVQAKGKDLSIFDTRWVRKRMTQLQTGTRLMVIDAIRISYWAALSASHPEARSMLKQVCELGIRMKIGPNAEDRIGAFVGTHLNWVAADLKR